MDGRRRVATAEAEPEDEIAVEAVARIEPNPAKAPFLFGQDRVQARPDAIGGNAAVVIVQVDRQREANRVGKPRQENRRRDPRGVGHRVGIDGRAVSD
ncbi:MAG TPA: hypothetical protein VKP69_24450, partial [Isosphaeraceae bacterium]|nr:hypothetical protein [Isosphaeraceae bacterium]